MSSSPKLSYFKDIIEVKFMWLVASCTTLLHTILIFSAPVPGCETGYLGPGGIHEDSKNFDCPGGFTGYVDRQIFGLNHIFQSPTSKDVYNSGPFDPEGILGTLTSIFQVMLGVQAGSTIIYFHDWKNRVIRWVGWGVVTAVLAVILAAPGAIPINKNLWSLSFVLSTSSAAFFVLSIIYIIQDHLSLWNGVPFKAPGMNPTILYVGSEIAFQLFPFHLTYGNNNTHFFFLLEDLWGVAIWTAVAYKLYFKRFFLSI